MSAPNTVQLSSQPPAAILRNLGLSPNSLMRSIHQMNSQNPIPIPLLSLPPPTRPVYQAKSPLLQFTIFPELPTELRRTIWNHACFWERDINFSVHFLGHIAKKKLGGRMAGDPNFFSSYEFIANSSYPTVLQICTESREVALTHYKLSFGTSYKFDNFNFSTPSIIYFNWECDRICFLSLYPPQAGVCERFIEICNENRLRYMALNVYKDTHWPLVDITMKIHSLKEVILFNVNPEVIHHWESQKISLVEMETYAAEHPASMDFGSQTQRMLLQSAQRDLASYFALNTYRARENAVAPDSMDMWQPPQIKLGYIVNEGVVHYKEVHDV